FELKCIGVIYNYDVVSKITKN
ncbi:MAG: hypothetical protein JWM14_2919, partial [Chitinophagaceae bacterium]|nr:hypothetical protein [Chitinophagaceae bacterium]